MKLKMAEVMRAKRGFAARVLLCAALGLVTKTQGLGEDEADAYDEDVWTEVQDHFIPQDIDEDVF